LGSREQKREIGSARGRRLCSFLITQKTNKRSVGTAVGTVFWCFFHYTSLVVKEPSINLKLVVPKFDTTRPFKLKSSATGLLQAWRS
jgi:hypothetical protein